MALKDLLDCSPGNIDIIALMDSGYGYGFRIFSELENIAPERVRFLEFYPIRLKELDKDGEEKRETFEIKNKEKYDSALKFGNIAKDIDYETFRKNPQVRMNQPANPDNLAVLVDDANSRGTTLRSAIQDMTQLKYDPKKILIAILAPNGEGVYPVNQEGLRNLTVNPQGELLIKYRD